MLTTYRPAIRQLLRQGYHPRHRPSGHTISPHFATDNGAAIPPNLLAIPNSESTSAYLRYCRHCGLAPHPARFPATFPEYFLRLLTDPGDLVVDPFAGNCVTGEVAERLGRHWLCIEQRNEYIVGARGRFLATRPCPRSTSSRQTAYTLTRPQWSSAGEKDETRLADDGGQVRPHPVRPTPSVQSSAKPHDGQRATAGGMARDPEHTSARC